MGLGAPGDFFILLIDMFELLYSRSILFVIYRYIKKVLFRNAYKIKDHLMYFDEIIHNLGRNWNMRRWAP